VEEESIQAVKNEILLCENEIQNKVRSAGKKQVPYATGPISTKKKTMKERPYQRLKNVNKEQQKEDVEKLWAEMEANKMNIQEDSKWYIVSSEWFDQWKKWSGFHYVSKKNSEEDVKDHSNSDEATKDGEVEEPGRIDNIEILDTSEIMLFGEYNLKDNLNEEQDYVILNPDIWRYLYSIYDGTPILRTGIKNIDKKEDEDSVDCIIEVNLVKLYIFEVPRENKQDYYEVMLASRIWDMAEIKYKI